jgi:tRNA A-37 threonylcarbamoyl transferase component Bud32
MEPHTWDRIQEVYHSALPIPHGQRCDFVARACDFDPVLTKQICSLLKANESSPEFIAAPIFSLGLRILSTDDSTYLADISDPDDDIVGSTIDGRYLVETRLADGGMARVYLAKDLRLDPKRVVVKVLLEKSLRNEMIVRKFEEEKKALASVNHPGVVTILDHGALSDKAPYLVMEYVAGVSLRELIVAEPEGLPFERAAFIIRGIGTALNAVHGKGIYHRDLKPENVMLQDLGAAEEQVKVVDFGIAKVKASLAGPTPIEDSVTMGTVAYMSPEQLHGDRVSAPSDVYSFAVIAYELLIGRRPFVFDTPAHLWEQQRQGIKAKPTALRPKLSEAAEPIILNGLAFEPRIRSEAGEFGYRLASALLTDAPAPPLGASKRPLGRWLTLAAVVALSLTVLTGASWLVWRQWFRSSTNIRSLPHRTLTYSFTVQKMRDGQPYQGPFESSEQKIFESGDRFRVNVWSRQAGFLYIFSQGPPEHEDFNLVFPTPALNEGTARLEQNQDFQTNWNTFVGETGKERLWIVWSQNQVIQLEIARHDAFKAREGAITDPSVVNTLKDFLSEHLKPEPEPTKDPAKQRTTVRAQGDLLVELVELEHR